jgi:hypothetical protein
MNQTILNELFSEYFDLMGLNQKQLIEYELILKYKNKVSERLLTRLKEYPSDNGPYRSAQHWANFLESQMIGDSNEKI